MTHIILIAIGGASGALARHFGGGLAHRALGARPVLEGGFPVGTLAVNLTGCLLAGVALALLGAEVRGDSAGKEGAYLLLVTGFLGALTTFSAFGIDSLTLLRQERFNELVLSIVANLIGGLGLCAAGWFATRAVSGWAGS